MAERQQYDIFISYSSVEEAFALRLHADLRRDGFSVWLDQVEVVVGDDLIEEVFSGIEHSRFFLIVMSESSVGSTWVNSELSAARIREIEQRSVRVLPLLYEDCAIPGTLGSKVYADFRGAYAGGFERLTEALKTLDRRRDRRPPPSAITAPDPGKQLGELKAKLLDTLLSDEPSYLVMDIGGTKAYVSLADSHGNRYYDKKFSTESDREQEDLFGFIQECVSNALDGMHRISGLRSEEILSRLAAIGLGFPGPTDFERGVVLDAPNLRMRDFPLAEKLQDVFGVPTYLENDVNLGVLGESWSGAARGYDDVLGIIIGTGIGGGVLMGGRIHHGTNHTAGEIGHLIVDYDSNTQCGCGQFGCLEALASRQAMGIEIERIKNQANQYNLIWKARNLGSNEIAHYYEHGDPDVVGVVRRASELCGKAVFSLLNLLNPEIIFFGGGFVGQIGEAFLEPILAEARKCMNAVHGTEDTHIPIVVGELPNPILVGACKMINDAQGGSGKRTPDPMLDAATHGLESDGLRLLRAIRGEPSPVPISEKPGSDFHEDALRELRNRGLIRTDEGESFKLSKVVQVTPLGEIVASRIASQPPS